MPYTDFSHLAQHPNPIVEYGRHLLLHRPNPLSDYGWPNPFTGYKVPNPFDGYARPNPVDSYRHVAHLVGHGWMAVVATPVLLRRLRARLARD